MSKNNNISKNEAYRFFIKFLLDYYYYLYFNDSVALFGRHHIKTITDAFDFMEKEDYYYGDVINIALIWDSTAEGASFWREVHLKYIKLYSEFIKNYVKYGNIIINCKSIW